MVRMEEAEEVLKEGSLEKRSDGLLQLWKKKHCVLTGEGLLLLRPKQHQDHHHHHHHHQHQHHHQQHQHQHRDAQSGGSNCSAVKQLLFGDMKTVDCVERKGKYVYFTVVMADKKEIDFRCPQEEGWNAEITLRLVQYKNRLAIQAVRCSRQKLIEITISYNNNPSLHNKDRASLQWNVIFRKCPEDMSIEAVKRLNAQRERERKS
eukprot:gi/632955798/ref/XP_007893642.1/ PREDICTED: pleckstrin homology-like domain family A member 1 [Callorhinchus milii]